MGVVFSEQSRLFLFAVLFGGLAGVIFDLFSHTAKLFKHKKAAIAFFDTVYCIICFFAAALFLLAEGNGQLDGYILFGAVAGAIAYFLSISTVCKRFFCKKTSLWTKK